MIGENAYLGESARFAKVGSEAWGTVTEESGTVLFDGVVNLTEIPDEGVFVGNPEGGLVPTVGMTYTVTINSTRISSDAIEMEGASVIFIMPEQGNQISYGGSSDEPVTFVCTSQYGHTGENTLRVELRVEPDEAH